jgi:threonine synthase
MKSFSNTGQFILSSRTVKDLQSIYNSYSVSNEQILETIKNFNNKYNYLADPHTATGLYVLDRKQSNNPLVSLACAHPAKFGEAIEIATGLKPNFPEKIKNVFDKEEKFTILKNNTEYIKKHILKNL